jgi:hypothetical protein
MGNLELWAKSVFGCKNVIWVQTSIMANLHLLQLRQGSHPNQPTLQTDVSIAMKGVQNAFEHNVNKAQFYGRWQFLLLVTGAIFFIVWRIVEMVRIS